MTDEPTGPELLDQVLANLKKYVAFTSPHHPVAVTLWIAATYAIGAWQHATRLAITSPLKRCGKSRLMDITAYLSHKPQMCANASTPALFRSITDDPPTLFMDEADALFGTKKVAEQNEELRGLFNAGWQRGRPVLRCVGPQHNVAAFDTFAMACLAAIKSLPDTITDRAVNIPLQRRSPEEKVGRFRLRRDVAGLEGLGASLGAWVATQIEDLKNAEPAMPVEDREADAWEPLIAIADAAGGDWPKRARAACRVLCASTDDSDKELDVLLLCDIKAIFEEAGQEFLSSTDLVRKLRGVEESPWDAFELTPNRLAHRLKPYQVRSEHNTARTARGYHLESFAGAFSRHIRLEPSKCPEAGPTSDNDLDGSKAPDGSKRPGPALDGSIRPSYLNRPEETPSSDTLSDGWTVLDGPLGQDDHNPKPANSCHPVDDPELGVRFDELRDRLLANSNGQHATPEDSPSTGDRSLLDLLFDFVGGRAKTTSEDVLKAGFDVTRHQASQALNELCRKDRINKQARGVFGPFTPERNQP